MPVVIHEFEAVASPDSGETRGGGTESPSDGQSSEAVKETLVLAAIRREASRLARLWAD